MKKLIAALLALCCLTLSAAAMADQLDDILAKGEIVIATEGAWAPWTFHDEDDKLVGFDVEVATLIAEKLGVKATFVECEWDSIFAGIDAKRYDIAANGVEATDERGEKYDFSTPYCYIHTALIVRADNEEIKTFEDLAGKKTCNSIASTYMILAENYGAEAVGVDTLDQTLNMVEAGRADATLNADVSFYDYMNVHPEAALKVVALTDDASHVVIPIRKGETALQAAIDKAIAELAEEGELSRLSIKYFGSDISKAE